MGSTWLGKGWFGIAVVALGVCSAWTAPINDDCDNAIDLEEGVPLAASSVDATDSGVETCTTGDALDVWFFYRPSVEQYVDVSLCGSDFDTTVAVFAGCNGTRLACNDQSSQCGDPNVSYLECVKVDAGMDYFIRVSGFSGQTGNISIEVTPSTCTVPVNDECTAAIDVEKGVAATGSTLAATDSLAQACERDDIHDVWYRYVPAVDERVSFSLCGSEHDTTLSIYDACNGEQLACNDDSASCANTRQSFVECMDLRAGAEYYIRVSGYNRERGNYELLVEGCAPSNDECAGALPVALGELASGTTELATDSGVSSCIGNDPQDLWYSYTAESTGMISVSACNAAFDLTLSVFDACGGALLACGDDSTHCGGLAWRSARLRCLPVMSGETYLIRIAGWAGEFGDFSFTVEADNCAPPSNDECGNAIALSEGVPYSGDTTGATGSLVTCSTHDALDVWHEFTATFTGNVDVYTCGSVLDTTLSIWDTCGGTQLACADDACGRASRIDDFAVVSGTTYKVRVAGYAYDQGAYTVAFLAAGQPAVTVVEPATTGPTNADTLSFTVRFDQTVANFNDASDLSIETLGVSYAGVGFAGSGANYTVTINGVDGDGTLRLGVSLSSDVANLSALPLGYTVTSRAVIIDNTAPSVALSTPALSPVGGAVPVLVSVSEAATGLSAGDLATVNATASALLGGGASYAFTLVPQVVGDFSASLPAATFSDLAGNANLASNEIDLNYQLLPPGITLLSSEGPYVTAPVLVEARLTAPVAGFQESDIEALNADVSDFAGGGLRYEFVLTPQAQGEFSAYVPVGAFNGGNGLGNEDSNVLAFTYDTEAPEFSSLNVSPPQAAPGQTVNISFASSESLTAPPEVTVNGNAAFPGGGKSAYSYSYTVSPSDPAGPAEISVSGFDLAGNFGSAFYDTSFTVLPPEAPLPLAAWPLLLPITLVALILIRRQD